MNRLIFVFIVLLLVSCGKKESETTESLSPTVTSTQGNLELGKKIFEGKGQCMTCHKVSQNVIGPSVKEIVLGYEQQGADMVEFLKGNLDPIIDPSQFQIMKINLEITKKMTDDELQALVDYMYYLSQK